MKSQRNHPRHYVALILPLVGLISAAILVLGLTRLASAQATAPSWSITGNLNTGRVLHSATLLPNGKVLVAGGYNCLPCRELNSAELYDPATGTWTYTGNLNTARINHTATLLPNGKVLVAGGFRNVFDRNSLNSAELYDLATGKWSGTGSLNTARDGQTATLLPNGKVLAAGGGYYANMVINPGNSAELYDTVTGTWSTTGNLNAARWDHTATLLPSGRVLVAGGFLYNSNGAELFDPATGTWSYTGNLNSEHYHHTAMLLSNGKVLVVGGQNSPSSAELYDPATRIWSNTGNLNKGRYPLTATLLPNGKVLVAGGADDCNEDFCIFDRSAELYDPDAGTWSYTGNLNTAHTGHTSTLLPSGKVLVAGGYYYEGQDTAELYDPGASSTPNQIDDAQFFVRQHYRDFLNREPDAGGVAFWTNEVTSCGGDAQCIEAKRITVSAAFYLSIEFQQTGYLVYRIYKASYGNLANAPVPLKFSESTPDTQQIGQGVIVNQTGWEQKLENNKQTFAAEFVQRPRFTAAYPTSLTPDQFVDTLFANAGVAASSSARAAAINEFASTTTTSDVAARARALRRVAENLTLAQQEFNRAFVLMQYFGYLRRNPNDAPELTLDFQGYNFWLNKLNSFNGNFADAEMVKAFISSTEYRQRFGQP